MRRFKNLVLVLMGLWISLSAMDSYEPMCLNYDANRITHPSKINGLESFYAQLHSTITSNQEKIDIIHIGGSHVQAGFLTNPLRKHFQNLVFSEADAYGLTFPYQLASTNAPIGSNVKSNAKWNAFRCANSKHEFEYGLMGMAVMTSDDEFNLTTSHQKADSSYYSFNRIIIYSEASSIFNYEVKPNAKSKASISKDGDRLIIDFKTSQTELALSFKKLSNSEGGFVIKGINYLHKDSKINYHSIGVNGAATHSYLKADNFKEESIDIVPDLVVFGLGINDSYMLESEFDPKVFKSNYEELLLKFKTMNPSVSFVFLTNSDSFYKRRHPNVNAFACRDVMHELAQENNASVYDLFEVMGGLSSIKCWQQSNLASDDLIHFNAQGYHLQADLFFNAMMDDYSKYNKSNQLD